MEPYKLWIAFYTIIRKDVVRILRIWVQTFLPSVVTSVLYFLVFGKILGTQIGDIEGVSYMVFVVPGLIMLSIVTTAYAHTSFLFFSSKFFGRNIDELLVSPMPPWLIITGFIGGGVLRSILVGALVFLVSLFFTGFDIVSHNIFIALLFAILTAIIFALAGLVNGIYAKTIDGINLVPTFVLTPLIYLGGIFYSVHSLPAWWQTLTHMNPLFYLINGFRWGFLGISDVSLSVALTVLLGLAAVLTAINWYLIRTGLGLKQ